MSVLFHGENVFWRWCWCLCMCDFRMCIPIRRWVFPWTEFSLSIPKGSWYRSTPKPISPRKLHSLFHIMCHRCSLKSNHVFADLEWFIVLYAYSFVSPFQLWASLWNGWPRLPGPCSRRGGTFPASSLLWHFWSVQLLERTTSWWYQSGKRPTANWGKLRKHLQRWGCCVSVRTPWSVLLWVILTPAAQIKSQDADYFR